MTNGKVGVLTFHRCINYGSYWQARCLVEGLRSFGHDAELLDHYSPQVTRAEWKCSFRPTLPTAVPRSDTPLYRKKIRAFVECIDSLPLSQPFRLEEPATAGEYDVAVVGSDEVWNLFHPWYGKFPVFFGNGLQVGRMVSYAASFGSYPWNYGLGEPWTEWLSRSPS